LRHTGAFGYKGRFDQGDPPCLQSCPDLPQTEIAIVEMTNAFRKENKLGEVEAEWP
jgi:hypothetical protein